MDISSRKKKILAAVIEEYIRTAEPVGSKAIAASADLGCSSATIRNELAELAAMGYLEQPHTSAGRVPTPLGYRMYVNELMEHKDLTAEENLLLYAKLYGVADPEHRVIELLDAVGLKHRRLDRVRTFSRGMTQRVSIARALVNDPSVVLLDEPYSGLDPHAMHIFDELIASVREGRTFVMVSHDLDKGLALASHVLVLARGRVVHFGEKDQMSPDEFADLYRTTVGMGVS